MWNVTSNVGGSVVSMYTRALLPPWIGAGTMGERGEGRTREDRRCLFACSFVRLFVRQFGRRAGRIAGTLAAARPRALRSL